MKATLRRQQYANAYGEVITACPTHVVMIVDGREWTFPFDPANGDRLIWDKDNAS